MKPVWILLVAPAIAMAAVLATGVHNARSDPITRHAAISLAGWPASSPPLRLALLSDMHIGGDSDVARLDRIVDAVNAERPDLVLIAGDFVNGHGPDGGAISAARLALPLARLRPRLGALAVLGNHDHWTAPASVRAALVAARVTVLDNEAVQRGPLRIIGIGDMFSGYDRLDRALASARTLEGAAIALTHSPDIARQLPGEITLVLAGHTHCGQVVLPIVGPLVTRGPLQSWRRLYDPRYRCGIVRDPGRLLVVTAGLGAGTAPIRVGAPPDWWLLTLKPTEVRSPRVGDGR